MKLNSAGLEAFYSVSRLLNFSMAAKELAITQSALSQRVLNLEDRLETKLFIREPSGIRLTESGSALLRYCQTQSALEDEVLETIAASQNSRKAELSGTIRIGGFSSVMRSRVMKQISPVILNNLKVKIEQFVREVAELPKMLKSGEIDFMILDYALEDQSLHTSVIGYEELILIESTQLKAQRSNVYLDHDSEDQTTLKYLQNHSKAWAKNISRIYLDDIESLMEGVRLGWGRAVIPKHLIEGQKGLRVVSGFKEMKTPIVLHYYKQPYYSQLHKALIKHLSLS